MTNPATVAKGPLKERLFYQIALRLAVVTVLFMLLEIIIVLAMYVGDDDEMSEVLISLEAERVAQLVKEQPGGLQTATIFPDPSSRAVTIFDDRGTLLLSLNAGHLRFPSVRLADLHSYTSREARDGDFLISGVRRVRVDGRPLWVVLAIAGHGIRPLLPALYHEVYDHALLPLIPLSLLLLLFNSMAVRRVLAPLERAMIDVESLDPAAMERRLHLPESPVEVRSLLRAVNQALDRLEGTMRVLQQFTADAAHELRTPLAVMTLTIDQLQASAEKVKLREEAAAMSRLIGQMLDLARAEVLEGIGKKRADLHGFASTLAAEMAPLAISAGRKLSYRNQGCPVVQGDAELLERALRNLIDNALTHTMPGTEVEVVVGPGPQVSVRDHGPGIPVDVRKKVFDRFWRADRRRSGAGLGLAIAQRIAGACGGRVELADAEGGGTRASLKLLAAPEAGAQG